MVLRNVVAPLALVLVTPVLVPVLWIVVQYLDGALTRVFTVDGWATVVHRLPFPTMTAVTILAVFVGVEVVLLRFLPAKVYLGPVSPAGVRPSYRANGVAAWVVTHVLFLGASYGLGWFSPTVVYDHLGELLSTTSVLSIVFCLWLYVKHRRTPANADSGRSGMIVMDYFWGVTLHPTVFGLNLKQLVNCRIGMMGWSLIVVSCLARQYQGLGHVSSGLAVSAVLQLAYIVKFFIWETGYFGTLDIMHDRFGYYLCWGVTTWLPGVYTLAARYLVVHPTNPSAWASGGLLVVGMVLLWINYEADRQRQRVRGSGGTALVWRRSPRLIEVDYTTGDGQRRHNILLASGWWGVARHFHYVPELLLALCWTLPSGFAHFLPYFYPLFLAILLVDRAGRDDRRCQAKYGTGWDAYRRVVRWRMLPFLY